MIGPSLNGLYLQEHTTPTAAKISMLTAGFEPTRVETCCNKFEIQFCMTVLYTVCFILWILIKLEFYQHALEKSSNIKFHGYPSIGSRVVLCRRTNGQTRHNGANSRFFAILRTRLKTDAFATQCKCFSRRTSPKQMTSTRNHSHVIANIT